MAKNDLQGTLDLLVPKTLSQMGSQLQEAEKNFEQLVKGVRAILRYA
jgi:hypothetical protein